MWFLNWRDIDMVFNHLHIYRFVLCISLFLFWMRGYTYYQLQSYIPIIAVTLVSLAIVASYFHYRSRNQLILKSWAATLIIYAIIRIIIWIIFALAPSVSAHAAENLSSVHLGFSFVYLGLGWYLFRYAFTQDKLIN